MSGNTSEALSDSILQTSQFTANQNPNEMINQDNSGFENIFTRPPSGKAYDDIALSQQRTYQKNEGNATNMMLNFDYSSIFDNKEALHNNSVLSGF